MCHSLTVPMDVNPGVRRALVELSTLLEDDHYSEHAKGRILAYTAREVTPTGYPELDPEDEHDAEMVFVAELPEVPSDSPAWDREDMAMDAGLLAEGRHPWPVPAVGDDDRESEAEMDAAVAAHDEWLSSVPSLPPVAGGGPEPFEPTAEDWADYRRWAEELDAREELRAAEERHNPMWGYE